MPSRKDQLHSYQFMLQRTISALVMRETDPAQSPLRRGVGAAFVGVMVTVIVAAAFGIYGLLTKAGNAQWKVQGAVVVEKETGAPFVYLNGKLVPTLNYTSALLLAGRTPPQTFTVPSNSLAGVARDLTRGIPGAPGGLPPAKKVLGGPWTACALPATDVAGGATVTTVLAVGQPADRATGGALATVGDLGLYVRDASEGGQFLIWHGHRYRLSGATVPTALFASGTRPVSVGSAWLDTLPEADPISDLLVPHLGGRSTAVADQRIGDVVVDRRTTGDVTYLVLADGLARLTPLQLDLLRAARRVNSVTLQPAKIAAAEKSDQFVSDSPADQQAPEQTPRLAITSATSGICAEFGGAAAGTPVLRVAADASRAVSGPPTGSRTSAGAALADVVAVPGGSVGVARSLEGGVYSLVTDVGVRFPVQSAEVLGTLGYSASDATALPAAVLNRIPSGPVLSKTAAVEARTATN